MKRVLIVANETAGGLHLHGEVKRLIADGATEFTLLVPATKPRGTLTWTEGQAKKLAQERMERALEGLRDLDAEFEGIVGEPRPMDAVMDVLRDHTFDEVIVSTLPHGVSRWLHVDLPARIGRVSGLPVHHIVGAPEDHRATA